MHEFSRGTYGCRVRHRTRDIELKKIMIYEYIYILTSFFESRWIGKDDVVKSEAWRLNENVDSCF